MAKRSRPRRGSMQYWPRKRASRIYTRTRHWPSSKDTKPLGFAAWKAGMTHIQYIDNNAKSPTYGKLLSKAVTVLDAPSLFVVALRFYRKTHDGLATAGDVWHDKLPKDLAIERKAMPGKNREAPAHYTGVHLLVATQPAKSGMRKIKPDVFEIALGGEPAKQAEYGMSLLGKEIAAKDIFRPGEFVDVAAVTKGHGFTGVVKRFGVRIQTRKDKQMHRHVGSIGSTTPRKVDWRVPQAGQYGFFTRTEFSKRIVLIDDDAKKIIPAGGFLGYGMPQSFMLIEGSVPGHVKRLVRLRKAMRTTVFEPVEVKGISLESKQGA
ncbi:MAG: 50S ribosomal protein L3 [Candidatus Aenigmarchaeota archaeon]|nr:50S ribosomal protein L3 [Candidatus Aenigmarchaeota archaeon]